jgi:hypothetical protein
MAGLDPAIPINKAPLCPDIGIAGSSPAMTGNGRCDRTCAGRVAETLHPARSAVRLRFRPPRRGAGRRQQIPHRRLTEIAGDEHQAASP